MQTASTTYIGSHPLRRAFVANQLERLVQLIVDQGEALLQDAALDFPPRAASSVLFIGERGRTSAADIAKALGQPHQLVTQRIELLADLGILEKRDDPEDSRRRILRLTAKGARQYRRLKGRLAEAETAFGALFAEIDCDLSEAAMRALDALERRPILDRVRQLQSVSGKS